FFIADLWFHDIRELDAPIRALYQRALEHGELETAAYLEGLRVQCQFQRGAPLPQLVPMMHAVRRFCAESGLPHMVRGYAYLETLFALLASEKGNPAEYPDEYEAAGEPAYMSALGRIHVCLVLALMGAWE